MSRPRARRSSATAMAARGLRSSAWATAIAMASRWCWVNLVFTQGPHTGTRRKLEELAGSACWLLASVARPRTHSDITAVTWSLLPLTTLPLRNLTASIITLQSTAL